jgi:hypothetical protein
MSKEIEAVALYLAVQKDKSWSLTPEDRELLDAHRTLTECINPKSKIRAIGCPECGRVGFTTTATIPKCRLTINCSGKPVIIGAKEKAEAEDFE